jgi:hypothetical protein
MPNEIEKLGQSMTKATDSGALSGLYDAILFVAVLGFSAIALLALAVAAPLALAVSAIAGAASALFAGASRRGGWEAATPV